MIKTCYECYKKRDGSFSISVKYVPACKVGDISTLLYSVSNFRVYHKIEITPSSTTPDNPNEFSFHIRTSSNTQKRLNRLVFVLREIGILSSKEWTQAYRHKYGSRHLKLVKS